MCIYVFLWSISLFGLYLGRVYGAGHVYDFEIDVSICTLFFCDDRMWMPFQFFNIRRCPVSYILFVCPWLRWWPSPVTCFSFLMTRSYASHETVNHLYIYRSKGQPAESVLRSIIDLYTMPSVNVNDDLESYTPPAQTKEKCKPNATELAGREYSNSYSGICRPGSLGSLSSR